MIIIDIYSDICNWTPKLTLKSTKPRFLDAENVFKMGMFAWFGGLLSENHSWVASWQSQRCYGGKSSHQPVKIMVKITGWPIDCWEMKEVKARPLPLVLYPPLIRPITHALADCKLLSEESPQMSVSFVAVRCQSGTAAAPRSDSYAGDN